MRAGSSSPKRRTAGRDRGDPGLTDRSAALYWAGAALGQKRLRQLAERTPLVEVDDLERAGHWFDRHGGLAVLIGRVVPVVRSLAPAGWNGCRCCDSSSTRPSASRPVLVDHAYAAR